jgi:hypothetical protein
MAISDDPQQGLFDREIEDGDLISALEEREKRNKSRKAVTAKYKEQHEKVKAMLDAYALGDEEMVRVGRFPHPHVPFGRPLGRLRDLAVAAHDDLATRRGLIA